MTPRSAPSPTTPSSSISTRALTLWSTSSTTLRWTCKFQVVLRKTHEPHLRFHSPARQTGSHTFSSFQVVLLHRFEGQQWELHQHPEHGLVQGATFLTAWCLAWSHFVCMSWCDCISLFHRQDINYTTPLIMPPLGVELRTDIYVQVVASNLTSQ